MSPQPFTVHPLITKLFTDAVRRLVPELPANDSPVVKAIMDATPAVELTEFAVKLTGRRDLGVLAAEGAEPGHFDFVELATRTQSNVLEALETLGPLLPMLRSDLELSFERGLERSWIEVRFGNGCGLHPADCDFFVATLLIAAERQTGQPLPFTQVALPYPQPTEPPGLTRIVSCALTFDAPRLRAEFPSAYLELPLIRADASMGSTLRELGRDVLERASQRKQSPLERDVRQRIRVALATGPLSALTLARQLSMSERTLRRRLEAEGLSLRALTDQARHQRALELLDADRDSTEAMAEQLGFTTAQAFHRAFRRWTGGTIQAYRARARTL